MEKNRQMQKILDYLLVIDKLYTNRTFLKSYEHSIDREAISEIREFFNSSILELTPELFPLPVSVEANNEDGCIVLSWEKGREKYLPDWMDIEFYGNKKIIARYYFHKLKVEGTQEFELKEPLDAKLKVYLDYFL